MTTLQNATQKNRDTTTVSWHSLNIVADTWFARVAKRLRYVSEHSVWWSFVHGWKGRSQSAMTRDEYLQRFVEGTYSFAPLRRLHFPTETVLFWEYADRLILALLLAILKSTFQHILSPYCRHMGGPHHVGPVCRQLERVLHQGNFHYVIRTDIKSYYASIDRHILNKQVTQHFDDPRVLRYLNAIIHVPIDKAGVLFTPDQGIPLRSSLSPFFAALYLTPLDRAFEDAHRDTNGDVFYVRYCDDIVILTKTRRQYQRAKKRLFATLRSLKLRISPHKTKMGTLKQFHFLGVQFQVTRITSEQSQVTTAIHPRSCRRALDKVHALRTRAVDPDIIRAYLSRWAAWWHAATSIRRSILIEAWIVYNVGAGPPALWIGISELYQAYAHAFDTSR